MRKEGLNRRNNLIRNMETVTIEKKEYEKLKKLEQIDWELVQSFRNSLDDLKEGRIKRVR